MLKIMSVLSCRTCLAFTVNLQQIIHPGSEIYKHQNHKIHFSVTIHTGRPMFAQKDES